MPPQPVNVKEVMKGAEAKMAHAIDALDSHYNTLRTGRASASLLDKVMVDNYGTIAPLKSVAAISTPDARTILVTPWDKGTVPAIEKALQLADLGMNPVSDGKAIRLVIPALTEERRKDLVKKAHGMTEDARVAIRNIRKNIKEEFEKAKKNKVMTDDELRDANELIQKATDKWVKAADEHLKKKEKEIMDM
jgi:ribosome recycling factor